MARDGQVELSADLSEDDLARVRVGQTATVTLPSGAVAQGRVRLVSPQIDPQTKLGEAIYASSQAAAADASSAEGAEGAPAGSNDDDVVDAEFRSN